MRLDRLPNWANRKPLWWWVLVILFFPIYWMYRAGVADHNWTGWQEALRCTCCGHGHFSSAAGKAPAYCAHCGAPGADTVRWVGRLRWQGYYSASTGEPLYCEWVKWEKLPAHLRTQPTPFDRAVAAEVQKQLPALIEREVEARTAAALEVERLTPREAP